MSPNTAPSTAFPKIARDFQSPRGLGPLQGLAIANDLLEKWSDYSNSAAEEALREWCEDNGIELQD